MKILKKITAVVLALTICLAGSNLVFAKTVETSEFGTFSYSLTRSGNKVTAITKTEKTAAHLYTTLEVQLNATGETIYGPKTFTKENVKINKVIRLTNYSTKKLAVFSCHEARGKTSVTKYLAEVF